MLHPPLNISEVNADTYPRIMAEALRIARMVNYLHIVYFTVGVMHAYFAKRVKTLGIYSNTKSIIKLVHHTGKSESH